MKIELECGISVDVSKEAFDDMRVLDLLAELEDGNPFAISKLTRLVFSHEDKTALYNALKDDNGRVPIVKFSETFTELFNKLGDTGKN